MISRWLERFIAPAIVALLVAGAANGAVYQWSRTAGNNATADATINWSEGMSPSSVNDSARAMMARIADWRDDFSGKLLTAGTSTAYTLTTNQGFTNPPTDGQLVAFKVHATNGVSATLATDGGTARPLLTSSGVAIPSASMTSGSIYSARYDTSAGGWLMHNFYTDGTTVPLGGIVFVTHNSFSNSNFVAANGQCISRTTYSAYFALVSTAYGACDGTTTFGVPDLRARLVGGRDGNGSTVTGRITVAGGNYDANSTGASGGAQSHTLSTSELPPITPAGSVTAAGNIVFSSTGNNTYTPSGSVSRPTITVSGGANTIDAGGTTFNLNASAAAGSSKTISASLDSDPAFTGVGISATFSNSGSSFTGTPFGGGVAFGIVPPSILFPAFVRVL